MPVPDWRRARKNKAATASATRHSAIATPPSANSTYPLLDRAGGGGGETGSAATGWPQRSQNRAPGVRGAPHCEQSIEGLLIGCRFLVLRSIARENYTMPYGLHQIERKRIDSS